MALNPERRVNGRLERACWLYWKFLHFVAGHLPHTSWFLDYRGWEIGEERLLFSLAMGLLSWKSQTYGDNNAKCYTAIRQVWNIEKQLASFKFYFLKNSSLLCMCIMCVIWVCKWVLPFHLYMGSGERILVLRGLCAKRLYWLSHHSSPK